MPSKAAAILAAAFDSNDFDAFELQLKAMPADQSAPEEGTRHFHWSKQPHMVAISGQPSWKLTLDLVTTSNQRRGALVVYRTYSRRLLQMDINLLTSEFPTTLADSLERVPDHARDARPGRAERPGISGREPVIHKNCRRSS